MEDTKFARRILEQYHFSILKDMVSLHKVVPKTNKKKAHIEALAPYLFTPAAIERGLAVLGRREKLALQVLQRTEGPVEANRLRLKLLRQGIIEAGDKKKPYGYYRPVINVLGHERNRTTFYDVIGRLMAAGLVCGEGIVESVYSQRTKVYYDNVAILYIPDSVRERLPEPPPQRPKEVKLEALTRVVEGSAREFQRDLYFYWSTVRSTPLAMTKAGRLYKKALQTVNGALLHPQDIKGKSELDLPRLLFMRKLLGELGLLQVKDSTLFAVEKPEFFAAGAARRIRMVFEGWRDGTFWNEVLRIPNVHVSGAGSLLSDAPPDVANARKQVLQHAVKFQGDKINVWVSIDQLVDHIRDANYDFLLPRDYTPSRSYYYSYYGYTSQRSPYNSYGNSMRWSFQPSFSDEAEGWEVVEAGFIRNIFLEPLHWMGLVDLAYDGDRFAAYRLTPVGAWVLGIGPEVEIPEGEGKVVVQPNFEIFALDPISDITLSKLDAFAERVSAERAIKYHLTRESVYRAQRMGWSAERILETLGEMSDTPIPQNVVRTLNEWQAIHERITIYRHGSLLQAVDAKLLDRLEQESEVASHLISRPDETIVLVTPRPGAIASLVQVLQDRGYPPARTRSSKDVLHPSFTIADNGELVFNTPLPSIYVYAQIAPFTGRDERDRYYLTQSAVQEAIAGGMTIDEILGRLRALHVGPLPRWVEIKVRAWGGYYGGAAIQELVLVQVENDRILSELLQEPELRGILRPFVPASPGALAVVSKRDLEKLKREFAERGIEIREELE